MLKFVIVILIFILPQCSFDNKTGIWNSINEDNKSSQKFKDFEVLYTKEKSFDKIIYPSKNLKLLKTPSKTILNWSDEFYQNSNSLDNFNYDNTNEIIFKSKKLTKHRTRERILYDGEVIINTDIKGNIIFYNLDNQKTSYKYNFYKKKFKKIEKNLNIIIEEKIIYIADNLGYLYAINYKEQKLLWAKNYKIPFRSNLKILDDKLILSNQNNELYVINKYDGESIKIFPTEEVVLKNNFHNSLAANKESLFFLNTYGSLYSINSQTLKIDWFISLNQVLDSSPGNLFSSNPVIVYDDKIIISTDPILYIINSNNGSTIYKQSINSTVMPIVLNKHLFLLTENNLLVCLNLETGEIIYSIDINEKIANFLDTKKKNVTVKSLFATNGDLMLFLDSSYTVLLSITSEIKEVNKLKAKIKTLPIFINNSVLYFNNKNQLIIKN